MSPTTVRELNHRDPRWEQSFFCASEDCPVVYFDGAGASIDASELPVIVFQKSEAPDRPVCYCFGHSVADVLAAERADGSNRVVEEITAACRGGLDRCEQRNPQGRCCLGNVRGLLREDASRTCCGGCS